MKVICEYNDQCNDETCPHAEPHESVSECGACGDVADARCVVDVESLPEIRDTGTTAIMIKRRQVV